MINDIIKLYKSGKELTLLEMAYFVITLISFVVAGVVALFNQSFGVSVLIIPLISLIAGVMNIVAWSLVKLIIEHLITSRQEKTSDKSNEKPAISAKSSAKSAKK